MLQIVNNKVYITQGQSGVYSREIRRNDTYKSPYVIYDACDYDADGDITTMRFPKIQMSIKKNIYTNEQTLRYVGDVIGGNPILAYIRGTQLPQTLNWLSLTKGGVALVPEVGKKYIIMTHGDYQKFCFTWNGTQYVKTDDQPLFNSQAIIDTNDISGYTDESSIVNPKKQLYRFHDAVSGAPYYQYYDVTDTADHWKSYSFIITIPVSAEDTDNLLAGTYYYELAIICRNQDGTIVYKDILLEPTEFVIGGSLSE